MDELDAFPEELCQTKCRRAGVLAIGAFITSLRTATNPADAESVLDGVSIDSRGLAYSTAVVILGSRAPAEWRRGAERLLFVPERPYFSAAI